MNKILRTVAVWAVDAWIKGSILTTTCKGSLNDKKKGKCKK